MNTGTSIPADGRVSPGEETCPLCGAGNRCGAREMRSGGTCWCARYDVPPEILSRLPVRGGCLCPGCLERVSGVRPAKSPVLSPRPDEYYLDPDGRMVFKAEYHLRRGFCCGSGCRHCPYTAPREGTR